MIIGIIIAILLGSAISVILVRCVYRMPQNLKLWSPPLQCPFCHKNFNWIVNIPLLGYWLCKRRCSNCHQTLSWQPFWIELCTMLGTITLVLSQRDLSILAIDLMFLYLLIAIAFIDWNVMIIEPRVIILAIVLRLAWLAWFDRHTFLYYLGSMCVAAGAFYFIAFFYETLRRQQGLGDGDAAVIGAIALWLGWEALSVTVLIAALAGLMVGGTLLILKKRPLSTSRVPFAPFLCLSGGLVHFTQDWIKAASFIL